MLKVFLTEDESVVREGLRDSIPWSDCGYIFAGEATDGEMALPQLLEIRPDVLITDIKMPFMDGLELSRIVSRELPDTHIIILSGYDDFEYARQAIELHVDQYLLKPIMKADMVAALERTRRHIEEAREQKSYSLKYALEALEIERNAFFEKLVNAASPQADLLSEAEALHIDIAARGYALVLFTLQPQTAPSSYSEPVDTLQDELLHRLAQEDCHLLFRTGIFSHAVLIKGAPNRLEALTQQCLDIIGFICESAGFSLLWYAAAGRPVFSLSALPQSFAETGRLLAHRHLMPETHILTEEAARRGAHEPPQSIDAPDVDSLDPLIIRNFLKTGLSDEVDSFVSEYTESLRSAAGNAPFRHYLLLNVRINAALVLQELGADRNAFLDALPPMEPEISAGEMRDYIRSALRLAMDMRDELSQKQTGDLADRALAYVDEHFADENISLNSLAKAINVSANYLSAVFSQRAGLSFVEYLAQKRMEKARQLLRQSNMRSGEIATAVGYKDPRYFSFVFKKTQGCTPKEYRAGETDK